MSIPIGQHKSPTVWDHQHVKEIDDVNRHTHWCHLCVRVCVLHRFHWVSLAFMSLLNGQCVNLCDMLRSIFMRYWTRQWKQSSPPAQGNTIGFQLCSLHGWGTFQDQPFLCKHIWKAHSEYTEKINYDDNARIDFLKCPSIQEDFSHGIPAILSWWSDVQKVHIGSALHSINKCKHRYTIDPSAYFRSKVNRFSWRAAYTSNLLYCEAKFYRGKCCL